ncbi:MAG: GT2 family glycosyltransferase [Crocinitomix sp.]|jgi:GT2 family glycosyltransferase
MERCLNSIKHNSEEDHNIILVDDGSDFEERQKIDAYLKNSDLKVNIATHQENKGYKLAITTGLNLVESSLVILLNNDTVVTNGYDKKLIEPILNHKEIAATAPVSNHPTDLYQYRVSMSDCTPENISAFQSKLALESHKNKYTPAPYLTGMCMALDYDLFRHTGLFDADYIHGYFEDLALSCKIRDNGHELIIVEDCLVYHDGHSTYKEKSQSEKGEIVMHNFEIFEKDWGHLPDHEDLLEKMDYAGKVCPL